MKIQILKREKKVSPYEEEFRRDEGHVRRDTKGKRGRGKKLCGGGRGEREGGNRHRREFTFILPS